jgi:MFS family permease
MIYAMRVVQGILSAFAIVAKRAFFVDVYEGEERRQYLSLMTIVWSAGPIVAPFIGGYLQEHFGWQSNFYLLAVYSGVIGVLEFLFSGETIRKKTAFNGRNLLRNFKEMIATPDFFLGLIDCRT